MNKPTRRLAFSVAALAATIALVSPMNTWAQAGQTAATKMSDRWLHVRVENTQAKGETVRVNVPLDLAEKVLPTINNDRLRDGKVKLEQADTKGVDLRAVFEAVRSAKDGEFVTVQGGEQDVRVAKQNGQFLVFVSEKGGKKQTAEIRVPMKVVEALLSAGKDELDIVAALHALGGQGDTELVSVKDSDSTVRVWLDAKNISD